MYSTLRTNDDQMSTLCPSRASCLARFKTYLSLGPSPSARTPANRSGCAKPISDDRRAGLETNCNSLATERPKLRKACLLRVLRAVAASRDTEVPIEFRLPAGRS